MKYYYQPLIFNYQEKDIKSAIEFDSFNTFYDDVVEDAAEDFYDNHDGWEYADSWHGSSINMNLWDSNKEFIGEYEVHFETQPVFTAYRVEE